MTSLHNLYKNLGVDNYYLNFGESYVNYHENSIQEVLETLFKNEIENKSFLDFCSGDGLITKILKSFKNINNCSFTGLDKYLAERYIKETKENCIVNSFEDVAKGSILNLNFDITICSFALHLCPFSILENVLFVLSYISKELIIISPSKNTRVSLNFFILEEQFKYKNVVVSKYTSKLNNVNLNTN